MKLRPGSTSITERNVYRNLGAVDKYGIDGSIAVTPIPELFFYLFGSYMKSEIKDDVQSGTNAAGNPIFIATAGKRESGRDKSIKSYDNCHCTG